MRVPASLNPECMPKLAIEIRRGYRRCAATATAATRAPAVSFTQRSVRRGGVLDHSAFSVSGTATSSVEEGGQLAEVNRPGWARHLGERARARVAR